MDVWFPWSFCPLFHPVHFTEYCFMWHLLNILVSAYGHVVERHNSRHNHTNNMRLCVPFNCFQIMKDQTLQQWSSCAYLCLRCGLQVTQPIAQPLSSQAELAILLLNAGHALEHHFIILSRQNGLQSVCAVSVDAVSVCASCPKRTQIHRFTCAPIVVHCSKESLASLERVSSLVIHCHSVERNDRRLKQWFVFLIQNNDLNHFV